MLESYQCSLTTFIKPIPCTFTLCVPENLMDFNQLCSIYFCLSIYILMNTWRTFWLHCMVFGFLLPYYCLTFFHFVCIFATTCLIGLSSNLLTMCSNLQLARTWLCSRQTSAIPDDVRGRVVSVKIDDWPQSLLTRGPQDRIGFMVPFFLVALVSLKTPLALAHCSGQEYSLDGYLCVAWCRYQGRCTWEGLDSQSVELSGHLSFTASVYLTVIHWLW